MAELKNIQLLTLSDEDSIFPVVEVVDNLTSTDATLPLSANQGKTLKDLIDALNTVELEVVASLPATGETGKIYLMANESGVDQNIYDEYVWIASSSTYEKLGTYGIDEIPTATADALGGIKIGYSESGTTYAVMLDSAGKAYVNVPWTDTTYSEATTSVAGLMSATDKAKLDGIEEGADKTNVSASLAEGTLVATINGTSIYAPTAGEPVTYDVATSSSVGLVALGSDTRQTVAAEDVSAEEGRTYAVQLNANNQMVVNVPWSDTVVEVDSTPTEGSTNAVSSGTMYLQIGLLSTALTAAGTQLEALQTTVEELQTKLAALTPPDGYELVMIKTTE